MNLHTLPTAEREMTLRYLERRYPDHRWELTETSIRYNPPDGNEASWTELDSYAYQDFARMALNATRHRNR